MNLKLVLFEFAFILFCLVNIEAVAPYFDIFLHTDASISVHVNGEIWLPRSSGIAIRQNGKRFTSTEGLFLYRSGTSCDKKFRETVIFNKNEAVQCRTQEWADMYTNIVVRLSLIISKTSGIAIFNTEFPSDMHDTSSGSPHCGKDVDPWFGCDFFGVSTEWPSISTDTGVNLGFMQFVGAHLNDAHNSTSRGPWIGKWNHDTTIKNGLSAGPFSVFNEHGTTLIMSPLDKFMSSATYQENTNVHFGIMGSVQKIPAGFENSVIFYFSGEGINKAFKSWGKLLLNHHGVHKRSFDFTTKTVGYGTDNGAYYYYHEIPNLDMKGTLSSVKSFLANQGIPINYFQLDSWFYNKSPGSTGGGGVPVGGGTKNWTANKDYFMDGDLGISELFHETKMPFVAHNRWWSNDTDYSNQNGGNWSFLVNTESRSYPGNPMALPTQYAFWEELFASSKKWGLYTYEQDWLWTNFFGMNETLSVIDTAEVWLQTMGDAALNHGITILYCMSLPRFALKTASISSVTQIRVSDDYGLGFSQNTTSEQWRIGRSSLLAWSLDLAPSKDGFYSMSKEPRGHSGNFIEPNPELEAAVATLSGGIVMVVDGVGFSNKELIMRSCDQRGMTLQPSKPMTVADSEILNEAFGMPINDWPNRREVWLSYSTIQSSFMNMEFSWGHIFVANASRSVSIPLKEIMYQYNPKPLETLQSPLLLYQMSPLNFSNFELSIIRTADEKITVDPRQLPDFFIGHVVPTFNKMFSFLGELEKWVPVSPTRFLEFNVYAERVTMTVQGGPGERVHLYHACFSDDGDFHHVLHKNTYWIPESRTMQIQLNFARACSPFA